MEYREELKYLVSDGELKILGTRLQAIMQLDKNTFDGESYNIRSIYFDTYDNNYFFDNEAGVNERFKVRIRIYNKSDSLIRLEIKHKLNGLTKKESCPISKELCLKIMNNGVIDIKDCTNNVLKKFYIEQQTKYLRPKVIVEYDRIAYIDKLGNVRVTFDRNIRASKYIERFFMDNTYAVPILEAGRHVLEVKYDEFLPSYIASNLELNTLSQTAFSKYYLSRLQLREEVL